MKILLVILLAVLPLLAKSQQQATNGALTSRIANRNLHATTDTTSSVVIRRAVLRTFDSTGLMLTEKHLTISDTPPNNPSQVIYTLPEDSAKGSQNIRKEIKTITPK